MFLYERCDEHEALQAFNVFQKEEGNAGIMRSKSGRMWKNDIFSQMVVKRTKGKLNLVTALPLDKESVVTFLSSI
jgi:hypothetical protein